ncbi:MAG: inositol monophosphatase family protein [Acidimicrobiia bacterium]
MTAGADELLALATELALEAGRLVREGRVLGLVDVETKSTATDAVTEYDRAAEALIVSRLRTARPHDGIVGEEGTADAGTSGVHWLIDPIDGTTNFLYRLPLYSVSIAARDGDGGLIGVVYAPMTDELFAARRGGGASVNGVPITCSDQQILGSTLVATGFGYLPERRARQGERVANLIAEVRDIRRLGSAAIDLCYVAAGRFDAYYEQWLNPWDLAAGEVIAREAGARIGEFPGRDDGEPPGLLVASPGIFDEMLALLRRS